MKTTKSLLAIAMLTYSVNAMADYKGPGKVVSAEENQKIFSQYCTGTADSLDVPGVNYDNADVMKAAGILSHVAEKSFYFYGDIKRMYPISGDTIPAGSNKQAHTFLKLLCGEFRDRATLIGEKIGWIHHMVMPGQEEQAKEIDMSKNVWEQMSGKTYNSYLRLSTMIWSSKQQARTETNITFGSSQQAEVPVPGFTVCETQYMFSEYLAKGREFDSLDAYNQGLEAFSAKCSQADREDYYDFRGDSNFKPNSPESNAMIWHSQSVAKNCADTKTAKDEAKFPSALCQQYFQKPFLSRFNAARSSLATWLMRDPSVEGDFQNESANLTIHPILGDKLGKLPFNFSFDGATQVDKFMPEIDMSASDLGFNNAVSSNSELAYNRLRDSVNRHTDWYHSKYNDGLGFTRDQAYSMFVASSYEMSKSNAFTSPGYTVPGASDGFKHWMFVFRVKKANWYNTDSLKNGVKYDADTMWVDETSFGTNGLADGERAWDRLGTAIEGELDSIIYLHNLDESGTPVANDKLQ